MKFLKKFDDHRRYKNFVDEGGITQRHMVSVCTEEVHSHFDCVDYSQHYLTFVALENGTFKFSGNSINYSLDNGKTWTELASNTDTPTITAGSKIMWKGELTPTSSNGIGRFYSSGTFDAEGNPMSLLYGDNFKGKTDFEGKTHVFYCLFFQGNIVNAKNIKLVATTITKCCYDEMFYRCYGLLTAPELPATTIAERCYYSMFQYCSSLTTAPELPALTLAEGCYRGMFSYCTSLTTSPAILPATALANRCYQSMFSYCTSLTTAPVLPATTLVTDCYEHLFFASNSLNYIKAMFTTAPSKSYTGEWVSGVASSGTFVKNSAATWASGCGDSRYPCNWTVETASS